MRRRRAQRAVTSSLLASALSISGIYAAVAQPDSIALPKLDDSILGQIGIVGQFTGLSTYKYVGAASVVQPVEESDGIISQSDQQKDAYLSSSLVDGRVTSSCLLGDGKTAILAGNFTHIRDSPARGIGILDLSTGATSSMANVSLGDTIQTLYCNGSTAWVGGTFQLGSGFGVGIWNNDNKSWSLPAFGGFESGASVKSITNLSDSIVFGGSFQNPLVGSSVNASGGGTVVRQPTREIGLGSANVSATGGTDGEDPSDLLCPSSGSGWTAEEGSKSSEVSVDLVRTVVPSKLRLYNLPNSSDGTKLFRLITFPSNSIMNLTYTDPQSGQIAQCDAWCTLPPSSESQFVEFTFVNEVETKALNFVLLDYYGTRAGLGGLSLFTEQEIIAANQDMSAPRSCQNISSDRAYSAHEGSWQPVSDFLSAEIQDPSEFFSTSIRYFPEVPNVGNYSMNLYTPGCAQAGTCAQRGQVSVSVHASKDAEPWTTTLFQTNADIKYDPIFNGTLDPSDGFAPYVEVIPVAGQPVPFNFVSLQVGVTFLGEAEVKIRNLFEFSPSNYTKYEQNQERQPIGRTTINSLGSEFSDNGDVTSLAVFGEDLLIGGDFSIGNAANLVKISISEPGSVKPVPGAQTVEQIVTLGPFAFVVGESGVYNFTTGSLNQVINQSVATIVPFSLNGNATVAFTPPVTGNTFNQTLSLWDLAQYRFYDQEAKGAASISGHLSAQFAFDDSTFYVGSVKIQSTAASGGATVDANLQITSQPFVFAAPQGSDSENGTRSRRRRRSLRARADDSALDAGSVNSILSGAYFNSSLSFLAGSFDATNSRNETATNIIAVLGDSSYPLPDHDFGDDAEIQSLTVSGNNTLVIAGHISGNAGGHAIGGVALYNPATREFASTQPAVLKSINEGTELTARAKNSSSVVAILGQFSGAGDVDCPSFCILDVDTAEWRAPVGTGGLDPATYITGGDFLTTEDLVLVGSIKTSNGTISKIAKYSFRDYVFSDFPAQNSFEGNPQSVSVARGENDNMVVVVAGTTDNGSQFISVFNNGSWSSVPNEFQEGTNIASTKVLQIQDGKGKSVLGQNQILAVSGLVGLPKFGNVSTASYDGNSWEPLFLATDGSNAGVINTLYSEKQIFLPSPIIPLPPPPPKKFMPIGHVVGVSCAVAVGCVSLLVILGLLWSRFGQSKQYYESPSLRVGDQAMVQAVPPEKMVPTS